MNRELLERPFPPEQIKQREGAFGDVRRSVGRPVTKSAPPRNRTCGFPAYGSSKRV